MAVQLAAVQAQAADSDAAFDLPSITKIGERFMQAPGYPGRTVYRYEHESRDDWGYEKPQKDWFNLVLTNTPVAKASLLVVLHCAGAAGNGDERLPAACGPEDRNFYGDGSFYVLCLDCSTNKNDWWWGYDEIGRKRDPYKDELCPLEERVLATIEWVIRTRNVDRNRVYLNGCSMGGSGSLGIGLNHGDIFAAVSVVVPAGTGHMKHRMASGKFPDPPPLFDISSHLDTMSNGHEELLTFFREKKYFLSFAWGPFGHTYNVSAANPAAYEFPWLAIRRNEAYPVFTRATTDNKFPALSNKIDPDQNGQINGYFRWKNIEDTPDAFAMELRLVKKDELKRSVETPRKSVADVTLRRLQKFAVVPGAECKWSLTLAENVLQSGSVKGEEGGLLTIPGVTITDTPACLRIVR
jgi:pimeloyl-ACP methyl ester carboxylesterase